MTPVPALEATVVEDASALEAARAEWDALAVAADNTFSAPALMLAWWHEAREGDARLRTVIVREEGEIVAVAPFFAQVSRPAGLELVELRFLGAGTLHRHTVLCRPGREAAAAAVIAGALRASAPRPGSLVFESIDQRDPWPRLLARHWRGPAGAVLRHDFSMPSPTIHLDGRSFDAWMGAQSSNFRSEMRRKRRQIEKQGAVFRRTSEPHELDADLASFARLHRARWDTKANESALDERIVALMARAGRDLLAEGRFRLWLIEADGQGVGAALFVTGGGDVQYWLGGHDPAWDRYSPSNLAILAGVEEACAGGARRLDFAGGDQLYKRRFADGDDPVSWRTLLARDARYPLTRAQLGPKHVRQTAWAAVRRLPPEKRAELKRLLRRGDG